MAKMESFDNGSTPPSFRVTDDAGKVVFAGSGYGARRLAREALVEAEAQEPAPKKRAPAKKARKRPAKKR